MAIDDHSRAGFVQMHLDERKGSAVAFPEAAVVHYATLGVNRLITDNGSAYPAAKKRATAQAAANTVIFQLNRLRASWPTAAERQVAGHLLNHASS